MSSDPPVAAAYLEHLSDGDLALLARARQAENRPEMLRRSLLEGPGGIEDVLASQEVFEVVFGGGGEGGPLVGVSPFLVFAVAVAQAVRQLDSATYVPDWTGVGRRTPVFDVVRLREFASSPWRRLFLAELLSSYTRVASGSVVVRTRRGLRRHRFSELDPVRLAGLLEVVSDAERPGVLRRLGDLSLFLTGVFPDYLARHGFGPIEEGRLLRAGGMAAGRGHAGPSASRAPAGCPVTTAPWRCWSGWGDAGIKQPST
jgi:hypothetical protein